MMKIWMKKRKLDFHDMMDFNKAVDNYIDYRKPLKMEKRDLSRFWVMVGTHESAVSFDVVDENIDFNLDVVETYGFFNYADLIEKNGLFIFRGNHIENGIVDFGDFNQGFEYFETEDFFRMDGTLQEDPSLENPSLEKQNEFYRTKSMDFVEEEHPRDREGKFSKKDEKKHKKVMILESEIKSLETEIAELDKKYSSFNDELNKLTEEMDSIVVREVPSFSRLEKPNTEEEKKQLQRKWALSNKISDIKKEQDKFLNYMKDDELKRKKRSLLRLEFKYNKEDYLTKKRKELDEIVNDISNRTKTMSTTRIHRALSEVFSGNLNKQEIKFITDSTTYNHKDERGLHSTYYYVAKDVFDKAWSYLKNREKKIPNKIFKQRTRLKEELNTVVEKMHPKHKIISAGTKLGLQKRVDLLRKQIQKLDKELPSLKSEFKEDEHPRDKGGKFSKKKEVKTEKIPYNKLLEKHKYREIISDPDLIAKLSVQDHYKLLKRTYENDIYSNAIDFWDNGLFTYDADVENLQLESILELIFPDFQKTWNEFVEKAKQHRPPYTPHEIAKLTRKEMYQTHIDRFHNEYKKEEQKQMRHKLQPVIYRTPVPFDKTALYSGHGVGSMTRLIVTGDDLGTNNGVFFTTDKTASSFYGRFIFKFNESALKGDGFPDPDVWSERTPWESEQDNMQYWDTKVDLEKTFLAVDFGIKTYYITDLYKELADDLGHKDVSHERAIEVTEKVLSELSVTKNPPTKEFMNLMRKHIKEEFGELAFKSNLDVDTIVTEATEYVKSKVKKYQTEIKSKLFKENDHPRASDGKFSEKEESINYSKMDKNELLDVASAFESDVAKDYHSIAKALYDKGLTLMNLYYNHQEAYNQIFKTPVLLNTFYHGTKLENMKEIFDEGFVGRNGLYVTEDPIVARKYGEIILVSNFHEGEAFLDPDPYSQTDEQWSEGERGSSQYFVDDGVLLEDVDYFLVSERINVKKLGTKDGAYYKLNETELKQNIEELL